MNDQILIIHQTAEDLLRRLQVDGIVEVNEQEEILVVNINSGEAALLIGRNGETLSAIEHLLRSMLHKQTGEFVNVAVDIEGYRQRHLDNLLMQATNLAKRVLETGHAEALPPMNAADRRLVHMKIKELEGVMSESIGEGPERKIVIKPFMKEVR